jgi:hypothetical protein
VSRMLRGVAVGSKDSPRPAQNFGTPLWRNTGNVQPSALSPREIVGKCLPESATGRATARSVLIPQGRIRVVLTRRCGFCGGPGPLTLEHILPEWIAREVIRGERIGTVASSGFAPVVRRFDVVGTFGLKCRAVCRGCNGGWMSALEAATKPILAPLLRRPTARCEIGCSEQMILASWCWKLMMILEFTRSPSARRFFTQSDRLRMATIDQVPPMHGTWIWIGHYNGQLAAQMQFEGIHLGPRNTGHAHHVPGFIWTGSIGSCCVQVMAVDARRSVRMRRVQATENLATAMSLLWPSQQQPIDWPPVRTVDDELFERVRRRFNP